AALINESERYSKIMSVIEYATNDPYLASFVLSEGAVLLGCRRLAPKRVEFRFESDWRLHELLRLYWGGQPIRLVPADLFRAHRYLKRRTVVRDEPDRL